MTKYDDLYGKLVTNIIINGFDDDPKNVRPKFKDGSPATTRMLLNQQLKFTPDEFPILSQKRMGLKDSIKEILWIWQKQSNVVQELRDMGCNVWNEWELEDGTIGTAYGWQLSNKFRRVLVDDVLVEMIKSGQLSVKITSNTIIEKLRKTTNFSLHLNQVDWLLYQLKVNPHSRRLKTSLWGVDELDEMALEPCVYDTHWQFVNNKLNLTVNVRSNDMALGNPYNVSQYAILHRMIAQVSGMEIGELCFNIDNAHIYHQHQTTLINQLFSDKHDAPTVTLNPEINSFYDFTVDDVKVENYKHSGVFKFEVAI